MQSTWEPTASKSQLQRRACVLRAVREFFQQREVLEVETPLVAQHTVTNPYIQSLVCQYPGFDDLYLQTSPEYHMKRLLAADIGSIFQICKSFRVDESGRLHNPEFTMLEWYRVGFDHHQLMDEMDALLQTVLTVPPAERYSYQEIFQTYLQLDPLTVELSELIKLAQQKGLAENLADTKDDWLMLLFSHYIEPHLQAVTFVHSFPASQAALSRINPEDERVCDRFEVYAKGMELANGFHELTNAEEQRQRFISENQQREKMALPTLSLDENFLQALNAGLPDCSGVALGIDRLVMIAAQAEELEQVISFPFARA